MRRGNAKKGFKHSESRKRRVIRELCILIAHDHEIIRIGLTALISAHPGWTVCGEAKTVLETLEKVKQLQPDVVLLALDLPDKGALEIVPDLLRLRPGLRILILAELGPTMEIRHSVLTPSIAKAALDRGVLGLALKPDARDILLALDAFRKNKAFVSSNIFAGMTGELHRAEDLPFLRKLTGREAEVFGLIATGRTNKEIASDLGISPRTVEAHRANVMHKLGFHSISDLFLFAIRNGVVAVPDPIKGAPIK